MVNYAENWRATSRCCRGFRKANNGVAERGVHSLGVV